MILDELDEDADNLDDETVLDSLSDDAPSRKRGSGHPAMSLPDWPETRTRDIGLHLDAQTLMWFKSTHTDWRRQIRSVLRAWIVAKTTGQKSHPLLLEHERADRNAQGV